MRNSEDPSIGNRYLPNADFCGRGREGEGRADKQNVNLQDILSGRTAVYACEIPHKVFQAAGLAVRRFRETCSGLARLLGRVGKGLLEKVGWKQDLGGLWVKAALPVAAQQMTANFVASDNTLCIISRYCGAACGCLLAKILKAEIQVFPSASVLICPSSKLVKLLAGFSSLWWWD